MIDYILHKITVWSLELAMWSCKYGDVYDHAYNAYEMEMKSRAWK
jgi:hypothetical protein